MALETSAERQQAMTDGDTAIKQFLKRTATMVSEATSYVNTLTTAGTDLASAKAVSDAMLAADGENLAIQVENATLAAKIAENAAALTQANTLKTQIETALAG